jgi:TPP-dependent pyruvate/acetoin dehydrogenase alpha subunit
MVVRTEKISDRASIYKMPGITVDGNEPLAVYEAVKEAVERARNGQGPTLIELITYRITGHSRRDPALYQPKEERQKAKEDEPIGRFAKYLLKNKLATEQELESGLLPKNCTN